MSSTQREISTPGDGLHLETLQKNKKKKIRDFRQDLIDKLDNLKDENPSQYWALLHELSDTNRENTTSDVSTDAWFSYFKNLNEKDTNASCDYLKDKIKDMEREKIFTELDNLISKAEIEKAISTLKNKKPVNQYLFQNGKCGVCGDPNQGPKDNEAGGRFATGTIGKTYKTGQVIDVSIQITADHRGWFEMKLCPNNNPAKAITHACLDSHLLNVVGSGTRYINTPGVGTKRFQVELPDGLQCSQCVLQWRWHAGNNYGVDPDGRGCIGCGSQEEFYGCADIAITGNGQTHVTQPPSITFRPIQTFKPFVTNAPIQTARPVQTARPATTARPVQTARPFQTARPVQTARPIQTVRPVITARPGTITCKAINYWAGVVALDQWCTVECQKGNCPPTACSCQGLGR
ncbi:unnamed protein product [Mytilus edulis]|uniref:Chitin-binding type-4 domain-containing protein n=1 Tax=Mytilus edulis TaxID=6550 RepID=A0A8S3S1E0_MYTED|nr:unnamed protein product [Mytilus edulis]